MRVCVCRPLWNPLHSYPLACLTEKHQPTRWRKVKWRRRRRRRRERRCLGGLDHQFPRKKPHTRHDFTVKSSTKWIITWKVGDRWLGSWSTLLVTWWMFVSSRCNSPPFRIVSKKVVMIVHLNEWRNSSTALNWNDALINIMLCMARMQMSCPVSWHRYSTDNPVEF